jgi:hypothetical protein
MGEERAQELFDRLARDYLDRPGVAYGRIWHNDGLTVHSKIFAMVVRGQLVVKVPAEQAAELCGSGAGVAFEPRPGRPMREWVCVDPPSGRAGERRWRQLIDDAYAYGERLGAPKRRPNAGPAEPAVSRRASSTRQPRTARPTR